MQSIEPKDKCKLAKFDDDSRFESFTKSSPCGVLMVPEAYGELAGTTLNGDVGPFVKWLGQRYPEINVEVGEADKRIVLRSTDFWIPLAFLAHDVGLPMYLNIVSSYCYERMKGALQGDKCRVHLRAVFEDKKSGVVKQFTFDGDSGELQKIIKRVDLNEFFDE